MSTLTILKDLQDAAEREAKGDKFAHMELLRGVQKLQNAVTTPQEKMMRLRFQIYQNLCVRLAQEHGILQALAEKGQLSAKELSEATKTDELLVVRLLRLITLVGIVDEIGPSQYKANETTIFSVKKGSLGDVKYYTDIAMKICSNMGPLARDGSKVDPHVHTFGKACFPWMAEHREYGQAFEDFMTARRGATWARWYNIFPAKEKLGASEVGDVLLVDVAGGQGYWTEQFRKSFSDTPGRVIVEDQPHVITKLDGIETIAYDFFTPQPISGARFYYFKQILHNWDDEKGAKILRNTAQAMKEGHSTLLIDDSVLPAENAPLRATYMDIAMMVLLDGGYERTEVQWKKLIESAGLRIVKIWYADDTGEGSEAVIECEKI